MRAAAWVQDSPVGPLYVRTSDAGLRLLDLHGAGDRPVPGDRPVDEVADALRAYFDGALDAVEEMDVDLSGRTPFSVAVLGALRRVPAKSLTSYGRLAAAAGRPGAGRAVGQAVGANPVPIVVPCHRVVAGDGSIGGFSGGLDTKRWLLAHEGHSGWQIGAVAAPVRQPE
ncbi:MAG TPA: methylated-DNA--[protein]-cysteine S-methyltransferase [Acidimicrobiales bacterium]|nr:methylated-DNA--[protein]-cysteine S-methyltransferase [Acidimicrobiales bacterium]